MCIMWKDFSAGFIKKNKASSISIVTAVFISALFLSLICSLFYNFWIYEIEQITIDEGSWQGRISGIDESDLSIIKNFSNVKKAEINNTLSTEKTIVADVWFQNIRTVYKDMPLITEKLNLDSTAASYHELLLSRYMVHNPQDNSPPLLMAFFIALLLVVSVSLILIIHNSFAVSMYARLHQFGILSSIGATPGQIFTCLLQEAAMLCILPILTGSLLGIAGSALTIKIINFFAQEIAGRHNAVFQYHPVVFIATIFVSVLTVFISACLPAKKLIKLTPLQALQGTDELHLKKKKHSCLLCRIFGIEGELAANALKAQSKALRTSHLSLTLSFLSFTIMLCFFTLADISTNYTYFERYQDAWDIMVTLKNTDISEFRQGEELRNLPNVRNSLVYQKAIAECSIPETEISDELIHLGDPEAVTDNSINTEKCSYSVKAPIIIIDDKSFEEYCRQLNIVPRLDGSIVLNRIWDSLNSNFRYKKYIPFVKNRQRTIILQNIENTELSADIPVLAYTQEPVTLREEYEDYTLVQFIPLSLWKQVSGVLGHAEPETYIRILGAEEAALSELNELQNEILQTLSPKDNISIENRIQEKISDATMKKGMILIFGALCVLLAAIGLANIFSNTLGFLRQRKREFIRYASIGMSPKSMKKMFAIEVLVIAGRPLAITAPLTIITVGFMITASYLDPMEFLKKAPFIPVLIFFLFVFALVGLAYYIGGSKLLKSDLIDILRNDTMI